MLILGANRAGEAAADSEKPPRILTQVCIPWYRPS
jgi:hypothetical protein